jgi:RNA polymerase-binding transcription factor DksA
MADICDIAQDVIDVCTEEAERRVRQRALPEKHPDFDGTHCVDCEDEIPVARLHWGKVRCVSCQEDLEQRAKTRIGWIPTEVA